MSWSILGTSSPDYGLVRHSTQWYTLWVVHNYPSDIIHYAPQSRSMWTTTLLELMSIFSNTSFTGTPADMITATDISVSQAPFVKPFITLFLFPTTNLNGRMFPTGTGFSEYIIYFVNITNGGWYVPFFYCWVWCNKHFCWCIFHIISLQYYVDFLYREKFHNNTSFLLADAILLIGITNFISPPVYQMGYIGLQLKYFSVLCNNKLQWTILPINAFWTYQLTALLHLILQKYVPCILQWWGCFSWDEIY